MPVFTRDEYENNDGNITVDEAWERLPVLTTIDGIELRFIGPLINLGHDGWVEELGQAAWGYLEDCSWQALLDEGGQMLDGRGGVRPQWAAAFGRAARRLAEEGGRAGPISELDRWASWIAYQMGDSSDYLEELATNADARE